MESVASERGARKRLRLALILLFCAIWAFAEEIRKMLMFAFEKLI
jgi:hypothetical protein